MVELVPPQTICCQPGHLGLSFRKSPKASYKSPDAIDLDKIFGVWGTGTVIDLET